MTVADTNILVHATVPESPHHGVAFEALEREASRHVVVVTRQILREYLAVMTRPQAWSPTISTTDALSLADNLARRFVVLDDGPHVWTQLKGLCRRYDFAGRQVHDANIVATMLAHRETRVLTFDNRDFRRFQPLIEVITP